MVSEVQAKLLGALPCTDKIPMGSFMSLPQLASWR